MTNIEIFWMALALFFMAMFWIYFFAYLNCFPWMKAYKEAYYRLLEDYKKLGQKLDESYNKSENKSENKSNSKLDNK